MAEDILISVCRCRFNNAVAELEFLGFVKRSKAKGDNMTKLTWGSIF